MAYQVKKVLSKAISVGALAVMSTLSSYSMADDKVVKVYMWPDYVDPKSMELFEKETGLKIKLDNFDSNEILNAKMSAGKVQYDVVYPSSNWAKAQIEGGYYQKLDITKLPNYKGLDGNLMKLLGAMDPGNQYIVPWLWGLTTIGYNEDQVKQALGGTPIPSNPWDLIFKPEYATKLKSCGISFLDTGDEVFTVALAYMGKNPYSDAKADYEEALKMLKEIRPNVTMFSSASYKEEIAKGKICVALGWNGDMTQANAKFTGRTKVAIPPKALIYIDTMAIPANAENPEGAHKFIDFFLRPDIAAMQTNFAKVPNGVPDSKKNIDSTLATNPAIYPNKQEMSALVFPNVVPANIRRLKAKLFTSFKAGG